MSYQSHRPSSIRVSKPLPMGLSFGELLEDLLNTGTGGTFGVLQDACAQFSELEQKPFDGQIQDVEDNWQPTGFYTPAQMKQVVTFVLDMKDKSSNVIFEAQQKLQVPSHMKILDAAGEAQRTTKVDPIPFIDAMNQAFKENINVIDSTGFKRWVVNCLKATREARRAASMVACGRPSFLLDLIAGLNRIAQVVIATVKAIVGAIIAVGEKILKIPDFLGAVFKYGKWAVLIGGALYVGTKTGLIPQDPLGIRK